MGKENHLLTQGNVLRVLFRFTVPFLIANIIQAMYGAVDLLVIGRYCSSESVAALATGTQVTQIITSMIIGLTLGSTILVGKYTGMQDEKQTRETIGTALSVFALAALALTAIFVLLARTILALLHTPDAAFALAVQYVTICSWGIFFICGYNAVSAILRGYGDSKRPMLFIALSCVLNIIGDIVLVKYAALGVRGVAFATIFSQAVSMVCAIVYLNKKQFVFRFSLQNLKIVPAKALELAKVAIPLSLQECMIRLSFLYLTAIVNSLGVYAASAVGIASKYDVFAMLPATSVASALAAFTAQNYGANKPGRATAALKAGVVFAFLGSACFFLWAQLSPQTMIGLFSKEPAIVQAGIPFFKTCSYDYLAVSFVFTLNGYLNGRSKTVFTMISSCFAALCLRMPLLWMVSTYFPDNLFALGTVAPAVSGVMALYTVFYVLRQFQKDNTARSIPAS